MKPSDSLFAFALVLSAVLPAVASAQKSVSRASLVEPECPPSILDLSGGCLGASSVPGLGLLYPLTRDLFVDAATGFVGLHTTTPQFPLDVVGPSRLDGGLVLPKDTDTLRFSTVEGASAPMIEMFADGTDNADRMILGHSPEWSTWGLKYEDAWDAFVFQQDDASPVMTVDMVGKSVQVHDGLLYALQRGHRVQPLSLQVTWDGSADIRSRVVRFNRGAFNPSVANEDLLELELPDGSSTSSQYIEAQGWAGEVDFRVDYGGAVFADGAFTGPADFAEMFRVTSGAESVEPGDVLEIDPTSARGIRRSSTACSRLVAGVYSTNPGFVGSERPWDEGSAASTESAAGPGEARMLDRADMAALHDEVPMAVIGVVPCKVSAENGAIQPGDLLVTSRTPGHAMRAEKPEPGTIVGKALEPLGKGTGRIRVLVTLQ